MKLCVVLLAAFGLSYAAVLPEPAPSTFSLREDFYDFLDLVDTEAIQALVLKAIETDPEIQAIIAFMKSDKFFEVFVLVGSYPEIRDFVAYLEYSGLNVREFINVLLEFLGHPPLSKQTGSSRSWSDLWEAVKGHIDIKGGKALFHEKLESSPAFLELYLKIKGSQALLQQIGSEPLVQEHLQDLRDLGIDVDKLIASFKNVFGWQ